MTVVHARAAGGDETGAVPTVVICDFDGTVASADVQHVIFDRFAGDRWVPVNDAWRRGEVSTEERSRRQWDMVHASQQEIADLVSPIPLDPGFANFVTLCQARGWPLSIASDGFDFYITRMLAAHGLQHLPVFANHMDWTSGRPVMTFARPNPACCRLGNCKRLIVEEHRPAGGRVVFVGDGLSDACGAVAADLVFAKGLLARYCTEHGIAYLPFADFTAVEAALTGLQRGLQSASG
jgi:2-hydroxy-3-keto-5-methylthiopentenyl-1-phosphate phosphatase